MFKKLIYRLAKRSQYKTMLYWQREIAKSRARTVFCRKALKYYEGEGYDRVETI